MQDPKLVEFPQDDIIIREGETCVEMYKIISGNAEVYSGYGTQNETLIGIIGKNSCFGEFGLLLKKPSVYTIKAYSDVFAMRITEEEIGDFMTNNHSSVLEIMRNMANSMMAMRKHIDLLIKEAESGQKPDKAQLISARKAMKAYGMYRSIEQASDILWGNIR